MLTKRQKQILDFINTFSKKQGYSPSLEEIGKHFRLSATSGIHQHVEALRDKGFLDKQKNQKRSIEVPKAERLVRVPLLGTIAAGQPIEAIESKEEIAVPQSRLPKIGDFYALRVSGDSMIEENVNDGDIILVKQQNTAESGQKVVALIDNSEATLKRFFRERGGKIRLQPANKTMDPILVNAQKVAVQGVMIDVLKSDRSNLTENQKYIKRYEKLPLNKIIRGHAVEELKKIPDKSIDLILADPPYGISRDLNCKNKRLGTTAKLNFNFGEWDKFDKEWFEVATDKTRGWIISFCAKKDIGTFWNILEKKGFLAIDSLVWQKPDPIPLNAKSRFLNAWEAIVVGKKPGGIWNSSYQHNILKFQAPKGRDRIHPTQKPVDLIKKLIELTTKKGDIVVDPFIGSGTTAVASIELSRNYIGFEVSEIYCRQSMQRIKNFQRSLHLPVSIHKQPSPHKVSNHPKSKRLVVA